MLALIPARTREPRLPACVKTKYYILSGETSYTGDRSSSHTGTCSEFARIYAMLLQTALQSTSTALIKQGCHYYSNPVSSSWTSLTFLLGINYITFIIQLILNSVLKKGNQTKKFYSQCETLKLYFRNAAKKRPYLIEGLR